MDDFMRIVAGMRIAQKQYFKTRDRDWLIKSKELEKQIDKIIEEDFLGKDKS